jgi:hypothetical protein
VKPAVDAAEVADHAVLLLKVAHRQMSCGPTVGVCLRKKLEEPLFPAPAKGGKGYPSRVIHPLIDSTLCSYATWKT